MKTMRDAVGMMVLTTVIFLVVETMGQNQTTSTTTEGKARPLDRRPSFWTKTADHVRNTQRMHRLHSRMSPRRRLFKPEVKQPAAVVDTLKGELKDFVGLFVNESAKFFGESQGRSRSYSVEEPQGSPVWEEHDQAYHASNFPTADYDSHPHHPHYIPHVSHVPVYYPPEKKDDTLFTKVALIALLKLVLAKLKAIGILKFMLFFLIKIPLLFFKFLFILKGFKLLKLVSIPFLIFSFALPFLPLLPFIAPLIFFPLLFIPLFAPLLLPLLLFLPIVPVTTPGTAVGRRKRDVAEPILDKQGWTAMDDKWKAEQERNQTGRARSFRTRARPVTMEKVASRNQYHRFEQYEPEESQNLIELTQKVVESEHCMERVACELASASDSQIYQSAVLWALGKVMNLAPEGVKKKISKYSHAYQTGVHRRSADYCQARFHCHRPKVILIQGSHLYNVF